MERHIGSLDAGARHLKQQVRSIDSIRHDAAGNAGHSRPNAAEPHRIVDVQASATPSHETWLPSLPAQSDVVQFEFRNLKLKPGMALQAQSMTKSAARYDASFLGIIEGKGMLVVPNGVQSLRYGMKAGERFVIRGFTGEYDFSFHCDVLRIFDYSYRDPPLAYALLAYPDIVSARKVRNAIRVRTCLPALLSPAGGDAAVNATVMDLSVAGALVRSHQAPGSIGDKVILACSIAFEDETLDLTIPATICRCLQPDGGTGFLTGLVFTDIGRNDKLALYYFVQSSLE